MAANLGILAMERDREFLQGHHNSQFIIADGLGCSYVRVLVHLHGWNVTGGSPDRFKGLAWIVGLVQMTSALWRLGMAKIRCGKFVARTDFQQFGVITELARDGRRSSWECRNNHD